MRSTRRCTSRPTCCWAGSRSPPPHPGPPPRGLRRRPELLSPSPPNGGVRPADKDAIASLAHTTAEGDFANSQVLAHPRLQFLGDVFATPASWPLHNVFSIGDIILVRAPP